MSNISTAPNFTSILDEAPTEILRPKPLPVGTYLCIVGQPKDTKPSKAGNKGIEFPLRPVAPLDDVDMEALAEVGGLEGKNLSITFWLTPDSAYRLDEFHENCGLDLSEPITRRTRNSEVANAQIYAVVTHQESEDHTQTYARVNKTARVD